MINTLSCIRETFLLYIVSYNKKYTSMFVVIIYSLYNNNKYSHYIISSRVMKKYSNVCCNCITYSIITFYYSSK